MPRAGSCVYQARLPVCVRCAMEFMRVGVEVKMWFMRTRCLEAVATTVWTHWQHILVILAVHPHLERCFSTAVDGLSPDSELQITLCNSVSYPVTNLHAQIWAKRALYVWFVNASA